MTNQRNTDETLHYKQDDCRVPSQPGKRTTFPVGDKSENFEKKNMLGITEKSENLHGAYRCTFKTVSAFSSLQLVFSARASKNVSNWE